MQRSQLWRTKVDEDIEAALMRAGAQIEALQQEARRQSDRAEGFAADCLKIRVAMGLDLHSHDDLLEVAVALRKNADRYCYYRSRAHKDGGTLVLEVAGIDGFAIGDFGHFIDATADAAMAASK